MSKRMSRAAMCTHKLLVAGLLARGATVFERLAHTQVNPYCNNSLNGFDRDSLHACEVRASISEAAKGNKRTGRIGLAALDQSAPSTHHPRARKAASKAGYAKRAASEALKEQRKAATGSVKKKVK